MSASVIASALLAAASLSISKPGEYMFVNPTETNLLTGVGMGAAVPAGDATPLSYTDAAFLTEAYAERYYTFADSLANVRTKTNEQQKVGSKISFVLLPLYLSSELTCGSNKTWLVKMDIPSEFVCVMTNSVLETVAGSNDVYEAFNTNATIEATRGGSPLDASFVAALYENLTKMRTVCRDAAVISVGNVGTNGDHYSYGETYTDYSGELKSDGSPSGDTPTTVTNISHFSSSDFAYEYHENGVFDKTKFRLGEGSEMSDEYYSRGGEWSFSENVCPGVSVYAKSLKHLLEDRDDLSFVKVKNMRLFGKGTFSSGYHLDETPLEGSAISTNVSTNATFVIEIPLLDIGANGVSESDIGTGASNEEIKGRVCSFFGDTGPSSLKELEKALPEPATTPAGIEDYKRSTSTYITFSRSISVSGFVVIVELGFNARVNDAGE